SFGVLGVPGGSVLVGAEVAQLALDSAGVVPAVDVGEDGVLRLVAGAPSGPVHQLDLQSGPEVFHQSVIVAVPCGPHRRPDPVVRQALREPKRRVVRTLAAVVDQLLVAFRPPRWREGLLCYTPDGSGPSSLART